MLLPLPPSLLLPILLVGYTPGQAAKETLSLHVIPMKNMKFPTFLIGMPYGKGQSYSSTVTVVGPSGQLSK